MSHSVMSLHKLWKWFRLHFQGNNAPFYSRGQQKLTKNKMKTLRETQVTFLHSPPAMSCNRVGKVPFLFL